MAWSTNTNFAVFDGDVLFYHALAVVVVVVVVVVVMVMVATAVDWVQDAVCSTANSLTERVILAFVVVIAHITMVLVFGSVNCTLFGYSDFFVNYVSVASCSSMFTWIGALVLPAAGLSVLLGEWDSAVSVVTLSDIDAGVEVYLGCWSVTGVVLAVFNVDLEVDVLSVRSIVAVTLDVAIFFSYADLLLSSPTWATAVFFGDADVFA